MKDLLTAAALTAILTAGVNLPSACAQELDLGQTQDQRQQGAALSAPDWAVKRAIRAYFEKNEIFKLQKGLFISTKPLLMADQPINVVEVVPSLLTTVVFPKDEKIAKVIFSSPPTAGQYYDNTLIIQPSPAQAPQFNAVLYLKGPNGIKVKQILFQIINPYGGEVAGEAGKSEKERKAEKEPPTFFPVVVILPQQSLTPAQVLEKFKAVYGYYPKVPVKFVIPSAGTFEIVPSRKGTVKVGNRRYFVLRG